MEVDSESAVKTVNFGSEIGSGSVSPSEMGDELEEPNDLGRGVTKMVPEILNVKMFLDGGRRSFMLM